MFWIFFLVSTPDLYDKLKSSKKYIAFQIQWSEFAAVRWWDFINQSQIRTLGIPLKIKALQQEPGQFRYLSDLEKKTGCEGWLQCSVLRSFIRTPQGYVSQIQRPI